MSFKVRKTLYKILTSKSIEMLYALLLILMFYIIDTQVLKKGFSLNNYFELKLATSLSATYFIAIFLKWIAKQIEKKIEDGLKLTNDYSAVIKQYKGNIRGMVFHKKNDKPTNISFGNIPEDYENRDDLEIYPIIIEYYHRINNMFSINDNPDSQYELPPILQINYSELFKAHKHSNVFNATNVRLDDIICYDNNVVLSTSRTSYFSGLITNRAMDHNFSQHLSVRKLFEYDSKISKLSKSKLSNHIGINGTILTKDNKIILVRRFNNVSIGKNIVGCSVGASLKTKYCLNAEGEFNVNGLNNAIINEIHDELGIDDQHIDFSMEKSIVGIYRDLVEGGKPQILFICNTEYDSKDIERIYKQKCKIKGNRKDLVIDGNKLVMLSLENIIVSKVLITDTKNSVSYETIPMC